MSDHEHPVPADSPPLSALEEILAATRSSSYLETECSQGYNEQQQVQDTAKAKKPKGGRPRKNHDPKVVARARAAEQARALQRVLEQSGAEAASKWLLAQATGPGHAAAVQVAWRAKAVAALRACPNFTAAAIAAGVGRTCITDAMDRDPEFRAQCEQAMRQGVDLLEINAFQRATEGPLEPVFHQGVAVAYVRKPSDTLMKTMLAARLPELYRPKEAAVSVVVHQEAAASPESVLELMQAMSAEVVSGMLTVKRDKSEE